MNLTFFDLALIGTRPGPQVVPWEDWEIYADGLDVFTNNLSEPTTGFSGSWVARIVHVPAFSGDDAEGYADGASVHGLNGNATFWGGAYVVLADAWYPLYFDSLETYADTTEVNGLNGGDGFVGAYVSRSNYFFKARDTFESYAADASVDGLNGTASEWGGAFVSR
jgi:hypothetical protein